MHGHLQPDLTFLFDLAPEVAGRRIAAQGRELDRFEQEKAELTCRVRARLILSALRPGGFVSSTRISLWMKSRNKLKKSLKYLFMNIIDLHSEVWAQLESRRERLPHALLLSGQRGIGSPTWLAASPSPAVREADGKARGLWNMPGLWLAGAGKPPDSAWCNPTRWPRKTTKPAPARRAGRRNPGQQITIDQVRARMTRIALERTGTARAMGSRQSGRGNEPFDCEFSSQVT